MILSSPWINVYSFIWLEGKYVEILEEVVGFWVIFIFLFTFFCIVQVFFGILNLTLEEKRFNIYERCILLILLSQMNNVPILPETISYGLSVGYPSQSRLWRVMTDSTSECLQYGEYYSEENLEILTLNSFQFSLGGYTDTCEITEHLQSKQTNEWNSMQRYETSATEKCYLVNITPVKQRYDNIIMKNKYCL